MKDGLLGGGVSKMLIGKLSRVEDRNTVLWSFSFFGLLLLRLLWELPEF